MNFTRSLSRMIVAASLTSILAACGQAAPSTSVGTIATSSPVVESTARPIPSSQPEQKQAKPSASEIAPFELPLEVSLPRSTTYAGLEWTVEHGMIDNRRVSLFGKSDDLTDQYRVSRIDLHVKNPLSGYTKLDSNVVKLQLADGKMYEADETGRVDLPGGNAQTDSKLIFRVPADATWHNAKLVISESKRVPAEIALDGAMRPSAFPQKLAATGSTTAEKVTYTIVEASFDLDLHAVRTKEHERFLRLKVQVDNTSTGGGGLPLSDKYFRLNVNGTTMAPADDFAELVKSNSSYEALVVFAVPEDLSATALIVGEGKSTGTITLDLTHTAQ